MDERQPFLFGSNHQSWSLLFPFLFPAPAHSAYLGMKTIALLLLTFALLVGAQPPPGSVPQPFRFPPNAPSAPTLSDNYLLSLVASEKDKTISELAIVVAGSEFSTKVPDTSFNGTLTQEEDGSFILRYTLGVGSGQGPEKNSFKAGSFANSSAVVRLHLGEAVPILKSDAQTFRVTLNRLSPKRARE